MDSTPGSESVDFAGSVSISPSDATPDALRVRAASGAVIGDGYAAYISDQDGDFGLAVFATGGAAVYSPDDQTAFEIDTGTGYDDVFLVGGTGAVTISPSDAAVDALTIKPVDDTGAGGYAFRVDYATPGAGLALGAYTGPGEGTKIGATLSLNTQEVGNPGTNVAHVEMFEGGLYIGNDGTSNPISAGLHGESPSFVVGPTGGVAITPSANDVIPLSVETQVVGQTAPLVSLVNNEDGGQLIVNARGATDIDGRDVGLPALTVRASNDSSGILTLRDLNGLPVGEVSPSGAVTISPSEGGPDGSLLVNAPVGDTKIAKLVGDKDGDGFGLYLETGTAFWAANDAIVLGLGTGQDPVFSVGGNAPVNVQPTGSVAINPTDPMAVALGITIADGVSSGGGLRIDASAYTGGFAPLLDVRGPGNDPTLVFGSDGSLSITGESGDDTVQVGPTGAVTVAPSDEDAPGLTLVQKGPQGFESTGAALRMIDDTDRQLARLRWYDQDIGGVDGYPILELDTYDGADHLANGALSPDYLGLWRFDALGNNEAFASLGVATGGASLALYGAPPPSYDFISLYADYEGTQELFEVDPTGKTVISPSVLVTAVDFALTLASPDEPPNDESRMLTGLVAGGNSYGDIGVATAPDAARTWGFAEFYDNGSGYAFIGDGRVYVTKELTIGSAAIPAGYPALSPGDARIAYDDDNAAPALLITAKTADGTGAIATIPLTPT